METVTAFVGTLRQTSRSSQSWKGFILNRCGQLDHQKPFHITRQTSDELQPFRFFGDAPEKGITVVDEQTALTNVVSIVVNAELVETVVARS
jgi:hypothetical protein